MNKKFHITIKDNENGMVYMDDDVIAILGAMLLNDKGSTRAVIQTPNAMKSTLEESRETAILNAQCIKNSGIGNSETIGRRYPYGDYVSGIKKRKHDDGNSKN